MKRRAGTVDVCGLPFAVYLANDEGDPGLKGLDGYCSRDQLHIVVRAGLPRVYALSVLRHELFHAVFYHMGCYNLAKGASYDAIEETLTLAMVPALAVAWDQARRVKL